ncbi:MAG: DUF309 domain-containing protein [Thermodesulfobacteriota bacterium]
MTAHAFDPFQDRLCRDIRNALSEAFASALADDDLVPALAVAERYRGTPLPSYCLAYIDSRLERYEKALALIRRHRVDSAWARGLILWDLGLFFEVHEVLEQAWHTARGEEREVLQAMIRAAGFHIKTEAGYHEAAAKLADKAIAALARHRALLPEDFPVDMLLEGLAARRPEAPRLGMAGRTATG